ncbi:hypothetical protein BX666DRAFT_1167714 [Dichotomocladium elegans]|nr:hypothetical protein BX666DRAFT_1167714 [Dichotomocladium elegans]
MNNQAAHMDTVDDLIFQQSQLSCPLECQPHRPLPSSHQYRDLNSIDFTDYDQHPYVDIFNTPLDLVSFEGLPAMLPAPTPASQPVKTRKKPGPKPNPSTPYFRKEKNRVAQRAFRARKEERLRNMEHTIENYRTQCRSKDKEIVKLKREVITQKAQVSYLKGLVLSLHVLLVKHKLIFPDCLPYMNDTDLDKIVSGIPHVREVYRTARSIHEKEMKEYLKMLDEGQEYQYQQRRSSPVSSAASGIIDSQDEDLSSPLYGAEKSSDHALYASSDERTVIPDNIEYSSALYVSSSPSSSLDPNALKRKGAIHSLQQQLRFQSKLLNLSSYNTGLQPTILQRIIPHDARIDLLPGGVMRDKMIIFKDFVDYDHCFSILVNGSTFHGTDPLNPDHWVLPVKFMREYW